MITTLNYRNNPPPPPRVNTICCSGPPLWLEFSNTANRINKPPSSCHSIWRLNCFKNVCFCFAQFKFQNKSQGLVGGGGGGGEYGNETTTLQGPLCGVYGNETTTLQGPLCGEYGNETTTLQGPLRGEYGNENTTLQGPLCGEYGNEITANFLSIPQMIKTPVISHHSVIILVPVYLHVHVQHCCSKVVGQSPIQVLGRLNLTQETTSMYTQRRSYTTRVLLLV